RAGHHLFTALVLSLHQRARHGVTRLGRWRTSHVPATRPDVEIVPPFRVVRHVSVVYLLYLGGVLDHKAIRLDEEREHIVAGTMPANTPGNVEAALASPPSPTHQAVDVRHLVGHVVERRSVAAR